MPTKLLSQEEIWKEFEKTGILDGWDGADVNINGEKSEQNQGGFFNTTVDAKNWNDFNGKKLIFRNCKNLKKIDADCLGLKDLEINNCPELEHLSAYNNELELLNLQKLENLKLVRVNENKLKWLWLDKCKNLENLNVRNNKLGNLDLTDNIKLTDLDCSINYIKKLKVFHLKKLEFLHCYFNNLKGLWCSGLTNLKNLNCHNNNLYGERLDTLNIDGCESLEILDVAENGLTDLKLSNHPNLKIVSAKENYLSNVEIENLLSIDLLDISRQGKVKWDNERKGDYIDKLIPTKLTVGENVGNLKRLFYTEEATFAKQILKVDEQGNDSGYESEEIDKKNIRKVFPKLKKFECSTGETGDFERYLDKLNKKRRARKAKKKKKKKKKTRVGRLDMTQLMPVAMRNQNLRPSSLIHPN